MCVTNFTKNGECSKCGNCCTPIIPITEEEVKKIREYIKENDIKMVMPITKEGRHIKCCFYDFENHKCNIYPVRPEVCRKFICSLNNKEIDKNKEYYDKRADYNGDTKLIRPMDYIFYDSPIQIIFIAEYFFNIKTKKELIEFLEVNKSYDIIEGIENGQIVLEESDE